MVDGEGPLAGVKVVDFSWNLPGPACTWLLAGMGAQVVKIEPPRGDPARHMPALFAWVNAGKQTLVLDKDDPASREAVEACIREADVVLEGFRPGKFAALGFSEARLAALNPSLVRCSISAYGQDGPMATEPGHDLNAAAVSGLVDLNQDERGVPQPLPLPLADLSAAQLAAARIVAALYARQRTGQGAYIDVAMTDAIVPWAALWAEGVDLAAIGERALPPQARLLGRPLRHLLRRRLRSLPHYGLYRCGDDAWLAVGIVDEDAFWRQLCERMGMPRMAGLPLGARAVLGGVLRRRLARRFSRSPRAHWLALLAGLPVTPVFTVSEARARLGDRYRSAQAPFAGAVALGTAPARDRL